MEKYVVALISEERKELAELVSKGKAAAQKITHARVLLQADESAGGPAWMDKQRPLAFTLTQFMAFDDGLSSRDCKRPWAAKNRIVLLANVLLMVRLRRV